MRNFLTESECAQLKAQHKKERDKRICDRIKAVLLYDKGWTLMQIAETLLITDEAVRTHIKDYKASKKLKPENGGSVSKLSELQEQHLILHLDKHVYLYVKDIVSYVNVTFKAKYSISGLRSWLISHNFSYKKPAIVPGRADIEAQKEWIEQYEKLKAGLSDMETICFIDGVHPTHNTQPAYGWIKKGVRKEIASNSGRSRLNLSGAIDILSKKLIVREDETLNAASTIAFFEAIVDAYPSMKIVHVFCDNAKYYRNKEVQKYLEQSKIKLHFLLPYSPNLNPIERLWK
jgi:transposase